MVDPSSVQALPCKTHSRVHAVRNTNLQGRKNNAFAARPIIRYYVASEDIRVFGRRDHHSTVIGASLKIYVPEGMVNR